MADALRQQLTDAVSKNITVVDKAGPGVLYVRIAASNVHLKKKSRGLLGYTPAVFVVITAEDGKNIWLKILVKASIWINLYAFSKIFGR